MRYTYSIPLPPITKKNSQQIWRGKGGRIIVAPSKKYQSYEVAVMPYLNPKPPAPLSVPLHVKAVYFMPSRRRVDLTNLLEATHDVLVKARIIEDDNASIIVSVDGSRVLYDKTHPRTEIEITALCEYQKSSCTEEQS